MGEGDLAPDKRRAAVRDGWVCFQDEAGRILRPPKAHTWSRRGATPATDVSGKGSGRVSIAGLVCFQPGRRCSPPRFLYRTREHHGRKGERRSFSERDYADFLDTAHQRLGGPIILIWDNLNTHISRRCAATSPPATATVYRLPPYAPELNEHVTERGYGKYTAYVLLGRARG